MSRLPPVTGFVRESNSHIFLHSDEFPQGAVKVGTPVRIMKGMSTDVLGKVSGFTYSSSGSVLALVKWLDGAPPLRIKVDHITPSLINQFWMVVPYNGREDGRHSMTFDNSARRHGNAPAIQRYASPEAAMRWIREEQRRTGFQRYVIMRSETYVEGNITSHME